MLFEIWKHGGTAQYAHDLADALSRSAPAGSVVSLVSPADGDLPELTGGTSKVKAVRIARYAMNWSAQQLAIVNALRKHRPQVAHFLGTAVASRVVYAACRALGVKSVVTVHDLPVRDPDTPAGLRIMSAGFDTADRILVHGEWTRNALGDQYGSSAKSRTAVVAFGTSMLAEPRRSRDDIRRSNAIPADARVALFFGSIRGNKGLDILLDAFSKTTDANLWLVVAGQAAGRSESAVHAYFNQIDDTSRNRIVWMTRFIPDDEIPEIFAMADVIVLPYRKSFASQSAVLGMAVATGTPMIVSDVGEIGPTVRKHALGKVIEPESASALSSALNDVTARAGNQLAGFTEAQEEMSWSSVATEHWNQYQSLL
jgi:glycosyltransferase involved in cell wall biosynthesis